MCLTKPESTSAVAVKSTDPCRRKSVARNRIMTAVPSSANVISDSERDDEAKLECPSSEKVLCPHEYHDHAYERDPDDYENVDGEAGHKRRGPRGGVAHPFPEKLHLMLDNVEEEGLDHIVSWHPHGRSFAVHKPKDFVAEIMPRYFKQTKLTSFQRQLNLYGFSRLTVGNDRGGYYHELFLRHRLFLCDRMMRTRIKGTGTKAAMNPESEPDFYSMPSVKPLSQTPRKAPAKTTWKMTIEPPLENKQDKKPKRVVQHRRVSVCEDYQPPAVKRSATVVEPPMKSAQVFEPPMIQNSEPVFPLPRPTSFPAILPLVMPVLPKSMDLEQPAPVITPPSTPMQEEDLLPPAPEMPDGWMLSDSAPLGEPLIFEGKTFHFLDACSFDCVQEDGGHDQAWGFSMKDSDAFFAGM